MKLLHNELHNTLSHQRLIMEKMADAGAEKDQRIAELEEQLRQSQGTTFAVNSDILTFISYHCDLCITILRCR